MQLGSCRYLKLVDASVPVLAESLGSGFSGFAVNHFPESDSVGAFFPQNPH